jgi:hypothetical protein
MSHIKRIEVGKNKPPDVIGLPREIPELLVTKCLKSITNSVTSTNRRLGKGGHFMSCGIGAKMPRLHVNQA